MPLREQWAYCYTKLYRNFGIIVTSPTESSNFNIKSYLLTSQSSIYGLVKSIKALVKRQLKLILKAEAFEGIKTKEHYLTRTYLGKLAMKITFRALELINEEYKIAKAAFPTLTCAAKPLKPCNGNYCSLS